MWKKDDKNETSVYFMQNVYQSGVKVDGPWWKNRFKTTDPPAKRELIGPGVNNRRKKTRLSWEAGTAAMFFLSVFVESIGNEGIFISQVTTQKKQENTRSIRLFAESTLLVFLSLSLSVAPVKLHFTLKKKQYNKKKNIKTENEHERKKTWKMESRGLSREKMLMYLLFYIKENSVMQTRGAILFFFLFFCSKHKMIP